MYSKCHQRCEVMLSFKNMTILLLIIHFDHKKKTYEGWGRIKSNQKCPLSKTVQTLHTEKIFTMVLNKHTW